MNGTPCASCDAAGLDTEAVTSSSNPDWSGYDLCAECAAELDTIPPIGHGLHPPNGQGLHSVCLAESLGSPCLELFARRRRDGWTSAGNAVDNGQDIEERLHELAR